MGERLGTEWTMRCFAGALAAVVAAAGGTLRAQCPELAKLPIGPTGGDAAGSAVSIHGDLAVVGAEYDDENGVIDTGSVSVFRFDGSNWLFDAKIVASDAMKGDRFGRSVDVWSDGFDVHRIVVGAPYHDGAFQDTGTAYVYSRTIGGTWALETQLFPTAAGGGEWFGWDVAIDAVDVVVGAPHTDHTGSDNGSLYTYRRDPTFGWNSTGKHFALDSASGDMFGWSVALSGDRLLVGSPLSDVAPHWDDGVAYAFRRQGVSWVQDAKLIPLYRNYNDYFGWDVAIEGDVALIGAPSVDYGMTNIGAAFVFTRGASSWVETDMLVLPQPGNNDQFGTSVALSSTIAAVGAPLRDAAGSDSGQAFTFFPKFGHWNFGSTLLPTGTTAGDKVGASVAASPGGVLVGSPLSDEAGLVDSGSASVFRAAFGLTATPTTVLAHQVLTFTAGCGTSGSPALLAFTSANGVPLLAPIIQLSFGSNEQLELSAKVPPGLSGSNAGFTVYKLDPFGSVLGSNEVVVHFL